MTVPARFADFQDALMPYLPGAMPHVVQDVFNTTARTFFRRTRVWKLPLGGFVIAPCTARISLNPVDQNADVCFIEEARLGDLPLRVTPAGPFSRANTRGNPSRIWLEDPHTAVVWPEPVEPIEGEVTLMVSVQPRKGVDYYPPESLTHYYDSLVSGCLGSMLMHPKKPYSDDSKAALYARRFETEISRAIARRENGLVESVRVMLAPVVSLR